MVPRPDTISKQMVLAVGGLLLYRIITILVLRHYRHENGEASDQDFADMEPTAEDLLRSVSTRPATPVSFHDSVLPEEERHRKPRAVIVALCRDRDADEMARTVMIFERRFNHRYHYPYVFLNEKAFSERFQRLIRNATRSRVHFGLVAPEEWRVPLRVNLTRFFASRKAMIAKEIIYGGSISYRQMCRYYSGLFQHHALLAPYEYYWRMEPGTELLCDLNYDPFAFMKKRGIHYGFTIALHEIKQTIPTLWNETLNFVREKSIVPQRSIEMFVNPRTKKYNNCHFWSNFEIASFEFVTSSEFQSYFRHLDNAGGFFYERWGDAPIHSLAAGLFLRPSQIHYFEDIGYLHPPFHHCPPTGFQSHCNCSRRKSFEVGGFERGSCLVAFQRLARQWISDPR